MSSARRHNEPAGPTNPPDADPAIDTIIHEAQSPTEASEERIAALIEAEAPANEIAREVESQEPADAADTLESLEPEETSQVLHTMDAEAAAEALAHMDLPLAATALLDLPTTEAASYLSLMDPDDAADLLQEAPKAQAQAWLDAMPRRQAAELGKLALHDPETAGGLMTTEFLKLAESATVAQAIETIRRHPHELDQRHIYCVDDDRRLSGVIELRDLLVSRSEQCIAELVRHEVHALRPSLDREAVAMAFDRYDYVSLPVIDEQRRLLGVVTIDDVIDIIREEHTEDTYRQVGVVGEGESVYASLRTKIRGRLPWLTVNLLTGSIAAIVVLQFDWLIDEIAVLAVVMPVIANQAGNAGQQSLAVSLRGLVLQEFRRGRTAPLLIRETLLGLISGFLMGVVIGGFITLLGVTGVRPEATWKLGVVAAVAMSGALSLGCLTGAALPLVLNRLRLDPATGSTIFLTMTTDTVSFSAFLGLTYLLRGWMLVGVT